MIEARHKGETDRQEKRGVGWRLRVKPQFLYVVWF